MNPPLPPPFKDKLFVALMKGFIVGFGFIAIANIYSSNTL
jgi:hypothetical protein